MDSIGKHEILTKSLNEITNKNDPEILFPKMRAGKRLINYSTPYILNGEFFEIISQEGESITVKCCHCVSRNLYKGSVKSTGNFHMHIKRKHPTLLPRVKELKLKANLNRKVLPRKKFNFNGKLANENHYRKSEQISNTENSPMTEIHCSISSMPLKLDGIQIKQEYNVGNSNNDDNNNGNTINYNANHIINTSSNSNSNHSSSEGIINLTTNVNNNNNNNNNSSQSSEQGVDIPCIQQMFEPDRNEHTNPQTQLRNLSSPTIESTLTGIERELRLRNQIESNRLFFDIAKFKFLNPNFTFNL